MRVTTLSLITLLATAACGSSASDNDAPPPLGSAPQPLPASSGGRAAKKSAEEIAKELEEKVQKGELPSGGGSMSVTGQIIQLKDDRVVATENVPQALHKHGEALRDIWVAPDGTVFATGYMYTGVPGPDTGVVYRRAPGGKFEIVYHKRENEFGSFFGTSSSDLYVAGVKTLAHFDGKEWKEIPIPGLEGSLGGVWGKDGELWVSGGDWAAKQEGGRIYRRDKGGKWSLEAKTDAFLHDIHGAGAAVWAVGDGGSIVRRGKDGKWKKEESGIKSQHVDVWAAAEDDVWVAGSVLLHSKGDGRWEKVDLPLEAQVINVWGLDRNNVYAGTLSGLLHLKDGQWVKTGYTRDTHGISGVGTDVWVTHDLMR